MTCFLKERKAWADHEQLEPVRRIFPLVAVIVQHYPLHPHEV